MAGLKLNNIRKSFGASEVIKGVSLDIEDGEFVVFVGPSGCGKSTLLRIIAGLEDITSGELEINGRLVNLVEPRERGIAMVFQNYAIFPHMSVRENMAFGLTIRRADRQQIQSRVNEAARILKMETLLERRPSQLSGGQRQRVAIGRAIVRDPDVFLFDEPLSNLDAALRMNTRMELAELHKRLQATMIYVTHDQVEAMTLADKIVVLRDGEVQQYGKPMDLFHHPANRFVAQFIGSPAMNILSARLQGADGELMVQCPQLGDFPLALLHGAEDTRYHEGQSVSIGIRPQYIGLQQPAGASLHIEAKLIYTERLGTETVLGLKLDDGSELLALLAQDIELCENERLKLYLDTGRMHLFTD